MLKEIMRSIDIFDVAINMSDLMMMMMMMMMKMMMMMMMSDSSFKFVI
jgi:hypothetical protein